MTCKEIYFFRKEEEKAKMKKRGMIWIGTLFLIFVLGGCGGPSMSVRVTVTPKLAEKMYPDKIPLAIGLYLSEEFKNYRVTDSEKTLGTTYDFWNLGKESAGMFEVGLRHTFQKVLVLEEKPPFTKAPAVPLQAIVEPAIESFDFKTPALVFQTWSSNIHYRVEVYDPSGKTIWKKSIIGKGEASGSYTRTLEELGANPSRPATRAIEDGTNQLLEALTGSEEIKGLVK